MMHTVQCKMNIRSIYFTLHLMEYNNNNNN